MPLFRRGEIRTYIRRSAFLFSFFFGKDSIADESQLTIGEMYTRPYFYRSWRSFDERFFSGFILLFVFADCDHLPIPLYAIWSLEEERESERDSKNVEQIFTRIARCFPFFVRIINIFVSWIVDSSTFALFFPFNSFEIRSSFALSFWMYLFWTSSFDDTRYCDNETMIHSILLRRPDWSTPVNQCRYSAVPH